MLEQVTLKNIKTNTISQLSVNGVFIFVGWTPNTNFINNQLKLNKQGYIVTDDKMNTSLEGVFACGDVREKTLRQVVAATGDGAIAANSAQHYLEK